MAKNSRSFPLPFKRMERAAAAAFMQMSVLLKKKRQANGWPFLRAFRIPAGSLLANIQRLITRCAVHMQIIDCRLFKFRTIFFFFGFWF